MQRLPEPELMDDPLQAQAYAAADFEASDAAFTQRILGHVATIRPCHQSEAPLTIIDLGCGPGNISFRLAEALPHANLLAVDGAAAMVDQGLARQRTDPQRWPRLHFHRSRLPLDPADLLPLPVDHQPPFQLIVCNSLLHHLHDPSGLWSTVKALAAPRALLMLRDLRRPDTEDQLQQLVRLHAAQAPEILRRDFSNSLRAAFTPEEVAIQLREAGLETFAIQALEDRYLEVWGVLP